MNTFKKSFIGQFKGWSKLEIALIVFMLVALMYTSYLWHDTPISIICTITGVLCVVLVAKGDIWNYFWGVINVSLYAYICYQANYGGDFVLNLFYYLPMNFLGLFVWLKNYGNKQSEIVDINSMSLKTNIFYIILLFVMTVAIGLAMPFINNLFGMEVNPSPFVDAFTTSGSILAMYLMIKRYANQWLIWILVNIFSVYMWAISYKDSAMTIMYVAYLLNSIFGYINWIKLDREQNKK